jgi:hypothetical protein
VASNSAVNPVASSRTGGGSTFRNRTGRGTLGNLTPGGISEAEVRRRYMGGI